MAMKRVCDICGAEAMDKCYQFVVPSILTDNRGVEFKAVDSSMTDACDKCIEGRQPDIIAALVKKAMG